MSENKKGYLVVIKPDEKIEILPYKDYKDIQKGVGGHFERLHSEPVGDKDYTTQCINGSFTKGKNQFTVLSKDFYCNEEYLLSDECKFNPLATLLTQDVTDAGYTKNMTTSDSTWAVQNLSDLIMSVLPKTTRMS